MKVAIAGDHAGFDLRRQLLAGLQGDGHHMIDLGSHDANPSDYPDFARAVGKAITAGEADRGILVCGSGVGACVAANKVHGIRAAICHDGYSARQGVEHDDMNVLCLGSRVIGSALALELSRAFLTAVFSYEERHVRRIRKTLDIEEKGK